MSKLKTKTWKTCIVCGREFETARGCQKTCGSKSCADELKRMLNREHYAKFGRIRKTRPVSVKEPRMNREAFVKLMSEINAPIGDDEPLRKYVG